MENLRAVRVKFTLNLKPFRETTIFKDSSIEEILEKSIVMKDISQDFDWFSYRESEHQEDIIVVECFHKRTSLKMLETQYLADKKWEEDCKRKGEKCNPFTYNEQLIVTTTRKFLIDKLNGDYMHEKDNHNKNFSQ